MAKKRRRKPKRQQKKRRKLTAAQKQEKAQRKAEFMTIFVNGKQKRVRRPVTIEGLDAEEFILRNADPMWLHQNELWEYMPEYAASWENPSDAEEGKQGPTSS